MFLGKRLSQEMLLPSLKLTVRHSKMGHPKRKWIIFQPLIWSAKKVCLRDGYEVRKYKAFWQICSKIRFSKTKESYCRLGHGGTVTPEGNQSALGGAMVVVLTILSYEGQFFSTKFVPVPTAKLQRNRNFTGSTSTGRSSCLTVVESLILPSGWLAVSW